MDIRDNMDATLKLFELVNLTAQTMITQKKEIDRLYELLPAAAKNTSRNGTGNSRVVRSAFP